MNLSGPCRHRPVLLYDAGQGPPARLRMAPRTRRRQQALVRRPAESLSVSGSDVLVASPLAILANQVLASFVGDAHPYVDELYGLGVGADEVSEVGAVGAALGVLLPGAVPPGSVGVYPLNPGPHPMVVSGTDVAHLEAPKDDLLPVDEVDGRLGIRGAGAVRV